MAIFEINRGRRSYGRKHFINEFIRVSEVRLIDDKGQNVGVIPTREALKIAQDRELDLVLISEKANPPIAKILQYTKFLYEERKKQASTKAKSAKSDTKEFIFGPNIGDGDLQTRVERTEGFLEEGHRVKMCVKLSGRQREHPEIGMEKLNKAVRLLSYIARVEEEPKIKGNLITVMFVKK